MSIEKIFIPTVQRVENQITYENLPRELQKKVVMVVQDWEKYEYTYDCDYLVLPKEVNLKDYYCMPKTRRIIYEEGKNMKYAVLDDDLVFKRRNTKYWTGESNMDVSKRPCTAEDVLEMFDTYSVWLDRDDVALCGCVHEENPPSGNAYAVNSSVAGAFWVDGTAFANELDDMDLTCVKAMEDGLFVLELLSRGYGNRVSQEFLLCNHSVHKKLDSTFWDEQTFDQTHRDHKIIQNKFPGVFEILYDKAGQRVPGGFRQQGKLRVRWSKAFNSKNQGSLLDFI